MTSTGYEWALNMQNAPGFKIRHALLAALLILAGCGLYMLMKVTPVVQTVVQKEKVNSLANLYVTEVNGGATTSYSYRFYLFDAGKSDVEFMKAINEESPFFITSDRHALKKIENGVVYLSTDERIYQFNNQPSYRYNNNVYNISVNLSASTASMQDSVHMENK